MPGVPLVLAFNPAFRSVSFIVHKHFDILSPLAAQTDEFSNVNPLLLLPDGLVSNLSNLYVSVKLRKPTQIFQPHGSFGMALTSKLQKRTN